ncbi:aldehyde dehydrogenase family protein [Novosphingobium aquimarinum]|uniref:aldehyde dehydrogenase family protein n=1 Tax=Novosphingobium aquimarinum TaxID=2682494 RepID=UPI0012ECB554|nr:aldehyde dehydrogenase family protein [Novosphingobium aquimarinum]
MTVHTPLEMAGAFVGNVWTAPGGAHDEILNPATEAVYGRAAVGTMHDLDQALDAARTAFDKGPWRRMSLRERARKMEELHAHLLARRDEIVAMIVAEAGCAQAEAAGLLYAIPLQQLAADIEEAYRRESVTSLPFMVNPGWAGDKVLGGGVKQRVPIGVVAAITPFNAGFFLNVVKASAALIAGNSVVLKPSPYTPFQAWVLADAIQQLDFPPGVFNVVTGGLDVAQGLTTDRRVDMVSFTGSDAVGAAIMAQGAPSLKRMLLELGGKSALIVREDADLDLAAQTAFWNITCETGQGCMLFTRHLVHNSVKQGFLDRMSALFEHAKVGDPADPAVTMGPLIRGRERDRVAGMVDKAVSGGAEVVFGGKAPAHLDKGFFYEPTLLTGVDNKAEIARKEIFGPVGVVIGVDSDEEALAIANDSEFGLGGGIVSADKGRAYEMALELDAGFIILNEGPGAKHPAAPFGGFKRSGIGRESGTEGIDAYTEQKSIMFRAG